MKKLVITTALISGVLLTSACTSGKGETEFYTENGNVKIREKVGDPIVLPHEETIIYHRVGTGKNRGNALIPHYGEKPAGDRPYEKRQYYTGE